MSHTDPNRNTKNGLDNIQRYRWEFTLPMEIMAASQLSQMLHCYCKEFYFQGEEGKLKEYKHWQGCFSLVVKHRLGEVKNMLGSDKIHLEPSKNWFALVNYSSKNDTRIEGPYNHKSTFIKVIEPKGWQLDLKNELLKNCTNDRKIIWIVGNGNNGKTQFCKYMAVTHNAVVLTSGAKADLAHALSKCENKDIVLINVTKTQVDYFNYTALEEIKDGMMFASKYDSNMLIFNSPHVVVFSNDPPELDRLTGDRWDIRYVTEKLL